jgi:autotransporter-associated beta strand protein
MNAANTLKDSNRSFALDSSSNQVAKRLDDPMLSNRAFAIFFIVTILIAISLLFAPKAGAATQWWDTSGTVGDGLQPGNGNWSTSGSGPNLRWSSASTGTALGNWVNGNDAIFQTSGTSLVTVNQAITVNSMTFNGTGYTIGPGGGSLTLVGSNITTNADATISTAIGGSVGLTKLGTSTLTLSGANIYTGLTLVSAGTLILNGTNSTAGATTVNSAGTLQLGTGTNGGLASGLLTLTGTIRSTDATSRTISNSVQLGGNATFGSAGSGSLTFNGTVDLNGATRTLTITSDTTFANAISGSGVGLTKSGGNTLTFSGSAANTYNGLTTVNVGELDLNKTAGVNAIAGDLIIGDGSGADVVKLLAANQIANTSDVTINSSGKLDLNGNAETIDGLSSASSTSSVSLGTGTLTVGANNQATATFAGVISGTGGNLAKSGSGTQTLTGNNTYTGTTTVNTSGGTLEVANSGSASSGRISGTSNVTVNSGGTLLLSGSSSWTDRINDNATMTLNGGTFNTGGLSEVNGPAGSRTPGIGALTLTANSTINFGTGSSIIEFAGLGAHTPTVGPNLLILSWTGTPNVPGGTDQLLFAGLTSTFTSQFDQSDVSFNGVTGYNTFQITPSYFEVTAVPEPSTWAGAALALGVLGWSQRRRLCGLRCAA